MSQCPCNGRIRRGIIEVLTGYCSIIIRICKNSRGTKGPTYACLHPTSRLSSQWSWHLFLWLCANLFRKYSPTPFHFSWPRSLLPKYYWIKWQKIINNAAGAQPVFNRTAEPLQSKCYCCHFHAFAKNTAPGYMAILMRWADELGWSLVIARATDVQRRRQS